MMPAHWKFKFDGPRSYAISLELVFKLLCLLSFGSRNLDELWLTVEEANTGEVGEGPDKFTLYKDRLLNKFSIVTIVVSCLSASSTLVLTLHVGRFASWYYLGIGDHASAGASTGQLGKPSVIHSHLDLLWFELGLFARGFGVSVFYYSMHCSLVQGCKCATTWMLFVLL